MDFSITTTEFSPTDDQSWLGSRHGVGNARTVTLLLSAFGAAHKTGDANVNGGGWIKSGVPLAINAQGYGVPLGAANATDGTQNLRGVLFASVRIPANPNATVTHGALVDHGRVFAAKLPVSVPAAQQAGTAHSILFV